MTDKYPVPALLSFLIPGLGQLIKKEFWKAAALILYTIVATMISFALGAATAWTTWAILMLISVAVWFWSVYDAYNHVSKESQN